MEGLEFGWASVALIALGLFLVGGVIAFVRLGLKVFALALFAGAVLAIASGVMRL